MKIAITGGIGSGKSYVCRILEKQGIRVYDCDDEANRLMRTDARLQAGLKKLVGEQVYSAEGVLQKPVLAQFLLAGEANKQAVNDVVHPAVARDFEQSSYEWMESAILFELGIAVADDRAAADRHQGAPCIGVPRRGHRRRCARSTPGRSPWLSFLR